MRNIFLPTNPVVSPATEGEFTFRNEAFDEGDENVTWIPVIFLASATADAQIVANLVAAPVSAGFLFVDGSPTRFRWTASATCGWLR